MATESKIEWTEKTVNPVFGCTRISAGCSKCYAERMAYRLKCMGKKNYERATNSNGGWSGEIAWDFEVMAPIGRQKKPYRIFVGSMSDLFHEDVPEWVLHKIFAIMPLCPQHIFQTTTKRANIQKEYFNQHKPPSNLHMGVTAENQECADERIPILLRTPAAVRWISAEPLLGPLDLRLGDDGHESGGSQGWVSGPSLDWVVCGAETGPGARPMKLDWLRSIIEQCDAAEVPVFVKKVPVNGKPTGDMSLWPEWARRREFPQ